MEDILNQISQSFHVYAPKILAAIGALAVAVAIAFGIGGRDIAARKLEQWTGAMKSDKPE